MNLLKSVKTPTLIACATAAIIGLLLLIWPIFILQFICIILAIGLSAIGVMRIMTYFKEKKSTLPALNLALGLFLILVGIAMIAENSLLIIILPFLLCMAVWYAAFLMLQRTLDLFRAHVADWWIEAILAVVDLVFAIIMLATLKDTMLVAASSAIASLLSSVLGSWADLAGFSTKGSMILPALGLIYSAAAVVATEIFISLRSGKQPAAPAASAAAPTSAPSADSLDDLK